MNNKLDTIFACLFWMVSASYGMAQTPLSAIDWFKDTPQDTQGPVQDPYIEQNQKAPISAPLPDIEVAPLDAADFDAIGLLPSNLTGLPISMWKRSSDQDLLRLLSQTDVSTIPAMQSLTLQLLLAEASPPSPQTQPNLFLRARIDKLLEYGAVDAALAMLERASPLPADLVPTFFDISLLSDALDPICSEVLGLQDRYPYDADRIYCLARSGEWLDAVLMLNTVEALGELDPRLAGLLHRFLETEEVADESRNLAPTRLPTVLEYRLFEAIGEPLNPATLPRAFSVSMLSGDAGWRAQLDAAERLAQSGALASNRLIGVYSQSDAAASGGVWDRVAAVQALDQALANDETTWIPDAFDQAWTVMSAARMLHILADLFAERLLDAELEGVHKRRSILLGLMSDAYKLAAERIDVSNEDLSIVTHILSGTWPAKWGSRPAQTPLENAIFQAFVSPRVPISVQDNLSQGRLGEVILQTIRQFEQGAEGDPQDVREALSIMRSVGLTTTAEQAAIFLVVRDKIG